MRSRLSGWSAEELSQLFETHGFRACSVIGPTIAGPELFRFAAVPANKYKL